MIDFLKAYPSFTIHDYVWGLSAPLIKSMLMDATQVYYLDDKQQKEYKQWKHANRRVNRIYTDSKEDLDAFERELGI